MLFYYFFCSLSFGKAGVTADSILTIPTSTVSSTAIQRPTLRRVERACEEGDAMVLPMGVSLDSLLSFLATSGAIAEFWHTVLERQQIVDNPVG